jgi:hypothetical protein
MSVPTFAIPPPWWGDELSFTTLSMFEAWVEVR